MAVVVPTLADETRPRRLLPVFCDLLKKGTSFSRKERKAAKKTPLKANGIVLEFPRR
jgi:hypothetical protein